jgi:hypothetical protein
MLTSAMKGKIDELIRNTYNSQNMINTLNWYLTTDLDCSNLQDFAMGYYFGSFMQITKAIVEYEKYSMIFDKREKEIKSIATGEHKKKSQKKKTHGIIMEATVKEIDQIRDILKDWIPQFREKIRTKE